jgi:hypothetical protein
MSQCTIAVVGRTVNPDLVDEVVEEEQRGCEPCDRFEGSQDFVVGGRNPRVDRNLIWRLLAPFWAYRPPNGGGYPQWGV